MAAEVIEQKRSDKIVVFKKKRRSTYRRTRGHRQELTALRITEILTDGKKPSKAAPRPEAKKAEKTAAPKAKTETKPAAKKAEAKPAAKKPAAKAEKKTPAKKPAAKPKKK